MRKISCSAIGEAIVLSNLVLSGEEDDLRGYLLDRRIQSFRVLAYWSIVFLQFDIFDDDPLREKVDYFRPLSIDIYNMLKNIENDFDSSIMWGHTVDDQILKKALLHKKSLRFATDYELDFQDISISEKHLEDLIYCVGNILCPKIIYTARQQDLYQDIYRRSRLWARDILAIVFDAIGTHHVFSNFILETIICSGKFEKIVDFNGSGNPGSYSEQFKSTWENLWIEDPKYLNNDGLKKTSLLNYHSIYTVGNLTFS